MNFFTRFLLVTAILSSSWNIASSQGDLSDLSMRFLIAAADGDYPVVTDCIKKGVDVNVSSWDGVTALMYATAGGHKQIVRLLLEKGAKVNKQPASGISALIAASKYGFTDIAEMLIADSANVDLVDNYNASALHYSSLYNNDTLVFMLLRAGANPNLLARENTSPLSMAAINGSYESAYLLIDAGADVNSSDDYGFTPLMLASQSGYLPMVELLVKSDALVNRQNNRGFSALSLAIMNKYPDIVKFLLEHGANANENNTISVNSRTLAKLSGDTAIRAMIRKAGVRSNYFPAFKDMGGGAELNISSRDFMTGFFITQHDSKYNLDYNFGFSFRPAAKRINFVIPETGYYQFMERRHIFNFDLSKRFYFSPTHTTGINLGGKLMYSFGNYRGSNIPINGGFTAAPVGWIFHHKNNFETRLGYHYSNYGEKELGKSHFTVSLIYYFYKFKSQNINRNLKWIQ